MKKRVYLVRFRQEAKLSQTEAAKKLGINRPYYVIIETAKAMPTVELWLKIQKLLSIHDSDMWKVITCIKEEDSIYGSKKN